MGFRSPLGKKEKKKKEKGAATLVGHMGPTRAAGPPPWCSRTTPHVGV